jgi:cytochrome b561
MGRPIPANDRSAYTRVAIALHWAIALTIIALMVFGVLMTKEWMPNRFAIYQWHKSFGITVLVLSLLRLAWRLGHPPPPLPPGMKGWEVFAAKLTHVGFYALMIGMPLLGWAMTSASRLPIENELFYLIPLPDLPGVPVGDAVEARFKRAHEIGGYLIFGLLLLHVGGALKHHFVEKDNVLARMIPALRRR